MTEKTFLFSLAMGLLVAVFVLLAVLVRMQDRLCELKTERDEAREDRDIAEKDLHASRRHEGDALVALEDAERRARLADQQGRRGFEHVNLAYPVDALPDLPTAPLEADPWVAEMRQRWLLETPLTSEDEY